MPPLPSGGLLGPASQFTHTTETTECREGVAGTGVFGEGLKVRGPNGAEYMLSEDWPRRGDATGDTYRCIRRNKDGTESTVAIKVAKCSLHDVFSSAVSQESTISVSAMSSPSSKLAAWNQEVRLLRRLALSAGTNQNCHRVDGCVEDGAAKPLDVSDAASSTRRNACCPPAHTVELVTEFGGLKSLPSMRFLVTTPVCWKTLDARIKGAERGYMEAYSREEALRWSWQIVRGLWTLQEADIGYRALSLAHVLLTQPNGDVRLAGFDVLLSDEGEEGEVPDSRRGLWAVGRVLHMTLTGSTDREDDAYYYRVGRRDLATAAVAGAWTGGAAGKEGLPGTGTAGGLATAGPRAGREGEDSVWSCWSSPATTVSPLLACLPPALRPIVGGLLAGHPSSALPLGLALDALGEMVGEGLKKEPALARRRRLRQLEERWWRHVGQHHQEQQIREEEEAWGRGSEVGESEANRGEVSREMAEACLDLGQEWERRGKGYKAAELYRDAVAMLAGGQEKLLWKVKMEAEGWGRIAELYQGRGQHAKAKEVLTRLVKLHAMELESCRGGGGREGEAEGGREGGEEGRGHPRQQEEAWRTAIGRQIQEEACERLANVRVRLAASMRELGETTEALAQLNTAEQELRRAGAGEDLSMVHVLTGKAELYCEREEYVRALEIYEDALERRRKTVPREDPELASLLVGMAEVYAEKGDTDVALSMLVQAYRRMAEAKEPAFGKSGAEGANATSAPGSLSSSSFTSSASVSTPPRSLHKTASTASHSPSSTASSSCSEDDSERCRRGRELMVMAGALERIAQIFTSKKQLDDALMCHKAAHERKSAALARAHPAIALSLARMAAIYETKKDLKAAAAMHARALEVRRAVLPPTCPEIASSLFGLANAHQRLRAFESALAAYEEAEMIRRINVPRGETAPGAMLGLGDVLVNMSRPLKSLGRDLEAMAKLRDARETYLAAGLPMTDTRLKTVAENLKVLGMHLHKNIETATEGSGWAGGSASLPRTRRDLVGREELLVRHAASSASGPDWLPSKSRNASAPPSMKASKDGSTGGQSVPRSESLDQKRQQCSIQ